MLAIDATAVNFFDCAVMQRGLALCVQLPTHNLLDDVGNDVNTSTTTSSNVCLVAAHSDSDSDSHEK